MAYIIPVETRGAFRPSSSFVMPSLASAYFASSVAGATFFGETVLRATGTVLTGRSHTRRLYCSGVHSSLLAVRYFLVILRFKQIGLHAFRHSCRREKTSTTIVMMILTVVMFGISATIFSLETYLVADGLLHPQKYPDTIIDFYGPETTAQIILLGINVRHTWFLARKTKRAFFSSLS